MTPSARKARLIRSRIDRWSHLIAAGPAALLQGLTAMVAMLRAS
ncbi:MAG TPA: hypothetical protein VL221_10060 [Bacteroidota bacterium]|nr:hypothetical protein [Bacteroidota bacterium]